MRVLFPVQHAGRMMFSNHGSCTVSQEVQAQAQAQAQAQVQVQVC
jgi:hypothetical protein